MITRRLFVGTLAAVSVPGERLVLEAIAAERMPQRLVVSGVARSAFFELRDYGNEGSAPLDVLNRHGIHAVWEENGRFLFPFESLAERERAWRELSADPELRVATLRELSVFRAL